MGSAFAVFIGGIVISNFFGKYWHIMFRNLSQVHNSSYSVFCILYRCIWYDFFTSVNQRDIGV